MKTIIIIATFFSLPYLDKLASITFADEVPPNIIFILADDLGYGDTGIYGQKRIKTPNIDQLGKEGMKFLQAYAGCTVCAPSRCCLMTGKHTGHARIRGNDRYPLQKEDLTLAQMFKQKGYDTKLIGKWGLGEPDSSGAPTKKGFDSFFGYTDQTHAHNYYPSFLWKNDSKFLIPENVVQNGFAENGVIYSPDLFLKEAIDYLDHEHQKPFFLYFASTLPHANNERTRAKDHNGMEIPDNAPYNNESWPTIQKNHAAMITRLDRDIGKIISKLKEKGILNKTMIIFSSDNGPHSEGGANAAFFHSSGPFRGFKRSMTEGGIHVPLIISLPGKIQPGVTNQVVAFWDFFPTFAELIHQKAPENLDGISFLPTLFGTGKQENHPYLYWEFHEGGSKQAIRMDHWKGIRNSLNSPLELYDLAKDIHEDNNIAKNHPEIIEKMEQYLKSARSESPIWKLTSSSPPKKKKKQMK